MATYPAGTYTLKITGTVGNKFDSTEITVTFVDPCIDTVLTIADPDPFEDQTYVLRAPAIDTIFDIGSVVTRDTLVDCGPLTMRIFNDDGSPLDPDLFVYDTSNGPTQNNLKTLYTEDPLKKGDYPIRFDIFYDRYPANVVE